MKNAFSITLTKTNTIVMTGILFMFMSQSSLVGQSGDAAKQAREIITPYLEMYPGISAAVGVGHEIVWSEGFGFAETETKTGVTPKHQFRYYSLSKSITGLALAKLVEEGKLDIDRGIRAYLPDLPVTFDPVKVKHLINHTAGVRHYKKGEWLKVSRSQCVNTATAILPFINDPLNSVPGEKYSYSSFGYVLLSHLVNTISGMSLQDYVQATLFEPLGISDIAIDNSPSLDNEVSYYSKWNAGRQKGKRDMEVNNSCKFGGGGYVGTAESLVKLYLGVLNQKVLSVEALEKFLTQIPLGNGKSTGYAFGIGANTTKEGVRYNAHSGSAVGAHAILVLFPEQKKVAVILCNKKDKDIQQKVFEIAGLF